MKQKAIYYKNRTWRCRFIYIDFINPEKIDIILSRIKQFFMCDDKYIYVDGNRVWIHFTRGMVREMDTDYVPLKDAILYRDLIINNITIVNEFGHPIIYPLFNYDIEEIKERYKTLKEITPYPPKKKIHRLPISELLIPIKTLMRNITRKKGIHHWS